MKGRFIYSREHAGSWRHKIPSVSVSAPPIPYRLAYLSFNFEAISDAGTRAQLMNEIITFQNTGT